MSKYEFGRVWLSEYRPPAYLVDRVTLHVDIRDEVTRIRNEMVVRRHPSSPGMTVPLSLDGQGLTLVSVAVDGKPLLPSQYQCTDQQLIIPNLPHDLTKPSTITIENLIYPQNNTALEGLYQSGGSYFTQCEAQGFRRITYYPDRPDVLARFSTTIEADHRRFPVLLSNGNLVASGKLTGDRHWATWEDPHPKPCYLFALVAGDLQRVEDEFVTASGRRVDLRMFVRAGDEPKCGHALSSLKRAMRWDEEQYGREYDLDVFMMVAVSDFNMGAMENKGLNIFNTQCVLADEQSSTDDDFDQVEAVVAHEYFHNWTGNRVTCRDWFQLSLKEGLTVFRDQSFSADRGSAGVVRIRQVNFLRSRQFPEDAGPMRHSVRPDSYLEINNFYTPTVYEKGAEVVRMLRTLLGKAGFRKGMDLYFSRHDGQAVTVEDFLSAMADANDRDLGSFLRWYQRAGTPQLTVEESYDEQDRSYRLRFLQTSAGQAESTEKQALVIPLRLGLIGYDGAEFPLRLAGETGPATKERLLEITNEDQTFEFVDLPSRPIPSLFRGFSAPIRLHGTMGAAERLVLMAHDTDDFNRWEAAQSYLCDLILGMLDGRTAASSDAGLLAALRHNLTTTLLDFAMKAQILSLPNYDYLADFVDNLDPLSLDKARQVVRSHLGKGLRDELLTAYRQLIDVDDAGARALKGRCLGFLMVDGQNDELRMLCNRQYRNATTMTDTVAALGLLVEAGGAQADDALADFYNRWQNEELVIDKWFSIQAASRRADTLAHVKQLLGHPAFNWRNPNRVRSLLGSFARSNPLHFHQPGGEGYGLLADAIIHLMPLNPQIAAKLIGPLSHWQRYQSPWREQMRGSLEKIGRESNLPRDIVEVLEKSLVAKAG